MNAFLGKVVGDFGASLSSALVYLGQKLGLYKALADGGPATPAELAQRTNTNERYVREWLVNQAARGYVEYDPASGGYSLTAEQAVALTDENSPFYVGGGFFVIKAMTAAVSRIEEHFRKGGGASMIPIFSLGPKNSSGPDTLRIWSRHGYRRSQESKTS